MKKLFAVLLITLMGVLPMSIQAAEPAQEQTNYTPYYLGAGAIGGVLVFNFLTGGVEALPFVASSSMLWEGPMAVNRVLTVASAVAGMLLVDWSQNNLAVKK
jgi:hypothetical protein